ncbi:MAG: YceI family protein [Chloroflexi bacterium]|nr:YceI family protein [Chloroflexota bacterium]MCY3587481.1 YceI family protein [Chloroflexota bacterium]MCY3685512.1 YceI family protein [Chloroflexota bacterium]MDE2708414.1 YceI family protein [Chloroflexota bacterium]
MLSHIRSLSPRRLVATGLILAGVLVAILLIILWQVGLFDSAPPPATLESAVESVRQDQAQQQAQEHDAAEQVQSQEAQAQEQASDEPTQSATDDQGQQDSASYSAEPQEQQSQYEEQDEEQEPASSYDYGQEQEQQGDDQQAAQMSEQEQTQQQVQQAQQTDQQDEQETMTPETPSLADLSGTWVLSGQGTSFVGYRIGEELANIGTATAVGRTGDVVVSLEFDGSVITSVVIEADLRTLKSDQSFRDGALRTRGIETDTYPFATFVLTEPISIDALPTGEEALSRTVQGTLDLHGVTNPVSIALEGQYVDGLVVVVGSTEIALADYDIEPPTGFRVLSIDDVGIMEFQLVLERAP